MKKTTAYANKIRDKADTDNSIIDGQKRGQSRKSTNSPSKLTNVEPVQQKSSRRNSPRKRSKSKKVNQRKLFEKQIDALPEFKGGLLATSGMNRNYAKSTKAIVDAQVDPTLFESNCYYKPKLNKYS